MTIVHASNTKYTGLEIPSTMVAPFDDEGIGSLELEQTGTVDLIVDNLMKTGFLFNNNSFKLYTDNNQIVTYSGFNAHDSFINTEIKYYLNNTNHWEFTFHTNINLMGNQDTHFHSIWTDFFIHLDGFKNPNMFDYGAVKDNLLYSVSGNSGNNSFYLNNIRHDIELSSGGNNYISIEHTAQVTAVTGGGGDDTIELKGSLTAAHILNTDFSAGGNNHASIDGNAWQTSVTGGDGDDTIELKGSLKGAHILNADFSAGGNNHVSIDGNAWQTSVTGGDGDDTVIVKASVASHHSLKAYFTAGGNNTLHSQGGLTTLRLGNGNDTVHLEGNAGGFVDGRWTSGNDTFILAGMAGGSVMAGTGTTAITITGRDWDVALTGGVNTVIRRLDGEANIAIDGGTNDVTLGRGSGEVRVTDGQNTFSVTYGDLNLTLDGGENIVDLSPWAGREGSMITIQFVSGSTTVYGHDYGAHNGFYNFIRATGTYDLHLGGGSDQIYLGVPSEDTTINIFNFRPLTDQIIMRAVDMDLLIQSGDMAFREVGSEDGYIVTELYSVTTSLDPMTGTLVEAGSVWAAFYTHDSFV